MIFHGASVTLFLPSLQICLNKATFSVSLISAALHTLHLLVMLSEECRRAIIAGTDKYNEAAMKPRSVEDKPNSERFPPSASHHHTHSYTAPLFYRAEDEMDSVYVQHPKFRNNPRIFKSSGSTNPENRSEDHNQSRKRKMTEQTAVGPYSAVSVAAGKQDPVAYSTVFSMLGQMTFHEDDEPETEADEEEEKILSNFISFLDGNTENNFQLFTPTLKISPRILQRHLK